VKRCQDSRSSVPKTKKKTASSPAWLNGSRPNLRSEDTKEENLLKKRAQKRTLLGLPRVTIQGYKGEFTVGMLLR
jgi:hypothetical protein